jgi:hypothetical protein
VRATIIAALSLTVTLSGCADKPKPPKKTKIDLRDSDDAPDAAAIEAVPLAAGVRVEIANQGGSCARTLCIAGPGALTDAANRDLGELCRRAPGVLKRCEGDRCASVWTLEQWSQGLEGLITTLDQDGDGKVDASDPSCTINVAAWSRGAVIAAEELPASLLADPRVAKQRAVIDRLVAIVPWAPDREQITVAANVRKAWIYRHSQTPKDDCSRDFEGGPWLSPAPVCGADTQCWDYDYSLEPALAFVGRRGARSGQEIGHCDIVALIAKIGLDNLGRGIEARSELVPRLSNGQPGGRVVTGPEKPDPIELLANPPAPD